MTDIKLLLKDFERYVHGQSLHTAFTELLDWALLPFKKFNSADEQTKAFETYQNHPKGTQVSQTIRVYWRYFRALLRSGGRTLYQEAIS